MTTWSVASQNSPPFPASSVLRERVVEELAPAAMVAPPINRISLAQAPAVFAAGERSGVDGKTTIVLTVGERDEHH